MWRRWMGLDRGGSSSSSSVKRRNASYDSLLLRQFLGAGVPISTFTSYLAVTCSCRSCPWSTGYWILRGFYGPLYLFDIDLAEEYVCRFLWELTSGGFSCSTLVGSTVDTCCVSLQRLLGYFLLRGGGLGPCL